MNRKRHPPRGLGSDEVSLLKASVSPDARPGGLRGRKGGGVYERTHVIEVARAFFAIADRGIKAAYLRECDVTRGDCETALDELAETEADRSGATKEQAHRDLSIGSRDYKRVYELHAALPAGTRAKRDERNEKMDMNPVIKVAKAFSMADREAQLTFLKSGEFTRDDCYEALGDLAKEEAVRSGVSIAKAHQKLSCESDVYRRVYDLSTALPPSGGRL